MQTDDLKDAIESKIEGQSMRAISRRPWLLGASLLVNLVLLVLLLASCAG